MEEKSNKKDQRMIRWCILTLLLFFKAALLSAQSSTFWGNSLSGGDYGEGFIYTTDGSGDNLEKVYHFSGGESGENPRENLTLGSDGRLYGYAAGGHNDRGIIFSISPEDLSYTVHHHFTEEGPSGSLLQASNGKLYGFESVGFGYIFEFDPQTSDFQSIHTFDKTEGRIVSGNNLLVEVSENLLVGVARRGGDNDSGVIFSYDLNTSTYSVLLEFETSGVGFYPESITQWTDNKLYGVTTGRGGTIFEYDLDTNEASLIYQFPTGFSGLIPEVLYSSDGNFYGVTGTDGDYNNGSLFRYNPTDESFTTLSSFYEFTGPHIPTAPLIEAVNGKIYGTMQYTAYSSAGMVIFEYDVATGSVEYPTLDTSGISLYKMLQVLCTSYDETVEIVACDSYTFDGLELTTSGTYQGHFQSVSGCDSLVTLSLEVNRSFDRSLEIETCDSYFFNGSELTASGEYQALLNSSEGCDSLVSLNLLIHESYEGNEFVSSCANYTFNGEVLDSEGTYEAVFLSQYGCDSIVNLTLELTEKFEINESVQACENFSFNGQTITESGMYNAEFIASNGCDSLVSLDLTILNSTSSEETVEACENYEWNGVFYELDGVYETTLTNAAGCDSIATLNLTILPDEACETILNIPSSKLSIYPNPTADGTIYLEGLPDGSVFKIFDSVGREVISGTHKDEHVYIDGARGIYIIQISTLDHLVTKKILKLNGR